MGSEPGKTESARETTATSQPTPARPAATVILARSSPTGFDVFLLRRLATASSFADAFVFPGGVVRDDDFELDPIEAGFSADDALTSLTIRGGEGPTNAALAWAFFRAAIREVFEEAGVLLALDASGQQFRGPGEDEDRWSAYRDDLQSNRMTLNQLLARERLTPDYHGLTYFSHWITPDDIPRRFDTRFFIAEMPAGQNAVHCQVETTESVWIPPTEALARSAHDLPLVLPTKIHLARLAKVATLPDLFAFARTKSITTVHSRRFADARVELAAMLGTDASW